MQCSEPYFLSKPLRHSANSPLLGMMLLGVSLLMSACDIALKSQQPQVPVEVCQAVTQALLGFTLPAEEKMAVSEQEIRGERIVVHLEFARPADDFPVKTVCVFGIDHYTSGGGGKLYHKVPTRMAVNKKQVTENDLLKAIDKAGLSVKIEQ